MMIDKNLFRDYSRTVRASISAAVILFIVTIIFLTVLHFGFVPFLDADVGATNVANLQAACSIIFTFILICVGWVQLHNITKTTKGDFLLRIDNRYGDQIIVRARTIIHELDCQTRSPSIATDERIQKLGEKIKDMGKNETEAEKFIYILNFLDFLETIAYFCNTGYISLGDLDQLLGNSLVYYYRVLTPWILHNREKYHNNSYYCEIETVVNKLKLLAS